MNETLKKSFWDFIFLLILVVILVFFSKIHLEKIKDCKEKKVIETKDHTQLFMKVCALMMFIFLILYIWRVFTFNSKQISREVREGLKPNFEKIDKNFQELKFKLESYYESMLKIHKDMGRVREEIKNSKQDIVSKLQEYHRLYEELKNIQEKNSGLHLEVFKLNLLYTELNNFCIKCITEMTTDLKSWISHDFKYNEILNSAEKREAFNRLKNKLEDLGSLEDLKKNAFQTTMDKIPFNFWMSNEENWTSENYDKTNDDSVLSLKLKGYSYCAQYTYTKGTGTDLLKEVEIKHNSILQLLELQEKINKLKNILEKEHKLVEEQLLTAELNDSCKDDCLDKLKQVRQSLNQFSVSSPEKLRDIKDYFENIEFAKLVQPNWFNLGYANSEKNFIYVWNPVVYNSNLERLMFNPQPTVLKIPLY